MIDVDRIVFGDSGQALAPPVLRDRPSDRADDRRFAEQAPPPPPPPPPARRDDFYDGPMIPSGTVLTIRMVDSVDSERDTVGQTFQASLDEPLFDPNGRTLVPRGADVVVKLVDDEQSGKIEGRTVLTLDIVSLNVNGRVVNVDTTAITEQSGSRTARSGKVIGGTAILGAIIGGIAGGGKGAAIGLGRRRRCGHSGSGCHQGSARPHPFRDAADVHAATTGTALSWPPPVRLSARDAGATLTDVMAISKELLEILVCPLCKAELEMKQDQSGLKCVQCKRVYPIRDDIPVMLVDEARIEE